VAKNKRKTETYRLDGKDVIRVYMNDESKVCELWLEEYNHLVHALKLNPNFHTHRNGNNVLTRSPTNTWLSVARVLVNAQAGEVVKYRDNNPLNLRSYNLIKLNGPSRRRDRDFIRSSMSIVERSSDAQ
jgi:hypothetical protein